MATVTFYEKPGCSGNARQKKILEAAGHIVVARSLLGKAWTRRELLSYFEGLPVADWFNRNAPAVKSGEIVPAELDMQTAVALLQRHPLLIRRPLLEADGERRVGFDATEIDSWIGLGGDHAEEDLEACRHGAAGSACAGHDNEHGVGDH